MESLAAVLRHPLSSSLSRSLLPLQLLASHNSPASSCPFQRGRRPSWRPWRERAWLLRLLLLLKGLKRDGEKRRKRRKVTSRESSSSFLKKTKKGGSKKKEEDAPSSLLARRGAAARALPRVCCDIVAGFARGRDGDARGKGEGEGERERESTKRGTNSLRSPIAPFFGAMLFPSFFLARAPSSSVLLISDSCTVSACCTACATAGRAVVTTLLEARR